MAGSEEPSFNVVSATRNSQPSLPTRPGSMVLTSTGPSGLSNVVEGSLGEIGVLESPEQKKTACTGASTFWYDTRTDTCRPPGISLSPSFTSSSSSAGKTVSTAVMAGALPRTSTAPGIMTGLSESAMSAVRSRWSPTLTSGANWISAWRRFPSAVAGFKTMVAPFALTPVILSSPEPVNVTVCLAPPTGIGTG